MTETQREHLEMRRARIHDLTRRLGDLTTSLERGGLPLHMNLAFLSTPSAAQLHQDMLSRLKHQNHRLTEVPSFFSEHSINIFRTYSKLEFRKSIDYLS